MKKSLRDYAKEASHIRPIPIPYTSLTRLWNRHNRNEEDLDFSDVWDQYKEKHIKSIEKKYKESVWRQYPKMQINWSFSDNLDNLKLVLIFLEGNTSPCSISYARTWESHTDLSSFIHNEIESYSYDNYCDFLTVSLPNLLPSQGCCIVKSMPEVVPQP